MVVISIFKCKLSKNLFSAENALTVTIPSKSSPKSEKMGDLVGLHPTKIPTCIEIADGQLAVGKPDENGRDKEVRENNTVYRYQPKRLYSLGENSRDGDDSGKETRKRGIDCLQ